MISIDYVSLECILEHEDELVIGIDGIKFSFNLSKEFKNDDRYDFMKHCNKKKDKK